jgi:hypothetical protein
MNLEKNCVEKRPVFAGMKLNPSVMNSIQIGEEC